MARKTTGEPFFGIEYWAECYVFPGLTQAQLESVPTAADPATNCEWDVGKGHHVQIFTWNE